MWFLSRLFKKSPKKAKPADTANTPDRQVPTQSRASKLTDMRHQASTGDPKLKGHHRSGSF